MIDTKFQQLLEENSQLNSLLSRQKTILDKCKTENNHQRQVYEELKEEYEQTKFAKSELSQKYQQLYDLKKEYEHEFETTIQNLKQTIEDKQLEIEEIQAKAIPSFDYNMIRIRIINELNQPHQEQLEEKNAEIEKLTNELNEQKRNFQLQIKQVQISKEETNRNIGYLKEKFLDSKKELENKIEEQQQKLDDTKDKETIKKLKRDLDDWKAKAQLKEKNNGELRLENDRVKDEKIEVLSQLNKQLETEKNQKRTFKQAAEKSSLRFDLKYQIQLHRQRYLEEEMQSLKLNFENKLHDFELLHKAKEDLLELDNRKDNQILTLQKRIQELETQIMNYKNTSQTQQMQIIQNEYEKTLAEKQKNEKLQSMYENLNIDFKNLKLQKKHLEEHTMKNYEKLQIDYQNLSKEENETKKKYIQYKKENDKVIQQMEAKDNLIEELEKELDSVKNKYRTTITKFQQPVNLANQENQTIRKNENSEEKLKQLRESNNKLKQKLKIANEKIIELLSKQMQIKGNLDVTMQNEDKYLEDVLQRNQITENQFINKKQIPSQYDRMQQNFHQLQIPRVIKTQDDLLMNEVQNLIKEKQYQNKL